LYLFSSFSHHFEHILQTGGVFFAQRHKVHKGVANINKSFVLFVPLCEENINLEAGIKFSGGSLTASAGKNFTEPVA